MSAITHLAPAALNEHSANEDVINSNAPPWLLTARAEDIARLREHLRRSLFLKEELSEWLKDLQTVRGFCEPVLERALRDRFGPGLDIHRDQLKIANRWPTLPPPIGSTHFFPMTYTSRSLLEAALQNFEPDERFPPLSHVSLNCNPKPLPTISLSAFVELVRELDLGRRYQQHLCQVFHLPEGEGEEADNNEFRLESAIVQQKKADMLVDAYIAYMKKDIDGMTHKQVCKWIELNVDVAPDGSRMMAYEVRILGVTLSGMCLFTLANLPSPEQNSVKNRVLVHIPNDPLTRFKLYASLEAFQAELCRRLWQPAYEAFFCTFVSQRDLPGFLARLRKSLTLETHDAAGKVTKSLNPEADLQLTSQLLSGELFSHLYRQQILRLQEDARIVAVPTEDIDQEARQARYLSHLGLGMTLLNLAAFANPWLGLLMMGVAVGQLLAETYEGYEDWRRGERDEAITHLMSVAEDIATMVALGVAMHWGSKAIKGFFQRRSDFFEDLLPVRSSDGRYRLWQADLHAYRHDVPALADRTLDLEGFYQGDEAGDGHRYLDIAGEPYRAYRDESVGAWRLRHPLRASAYEPLLEHNGAGAWRLVHEWPLQWHDPVYLFRRLGPDVRFLSDEMIEQILSIQRLDEPLLRRIHMTDATIPAPLSDSIQRFSLDNELNWLLAPADAPAAAEARLLDLKLQILPSLKGWPQDRTLMLLDGAGKPLREYGVDLAAQPQKLIVQAQDIETDGLAVVLNKLTIQDRGTLLGPGADTEQAPALLENVLRSHVREHHAKVFQRLYRLCCMTDSGLPQSLRRGFPDLPDGVLREVLGQMDDVLVERLGSRDRLPLQLIEEMGESLREVRVNQALEGGFLNNPDSLDTVRLQLSMLKTMGGWPKDVRWEIRRDRFDGPLLIEMGDFDFSRRRVLVRTTWGYQAFDGTGLSLGPKAKGPYALSAALLSGLRLIEREAMAVKLGEADLLHKLLMSKLLERPRVELEETLGLPARKSEYRSRVWRNNDVPGCLRVRRGGVYGSRRGLRRLSRLYPDLCEPEARNLYIALGDDPLQVRNRLEGLEEELRQLRSTLSGWRGGEASIHRRHAWLGGMDESREQASSIIERCWRWQTPRTYDENGVVIGRSLSLAGLRVDSLPGLPFGISFDHVTELSLKNMGVERIPEDFLEHFSNLRVLELNNNQLEFLPNAIADMSELRELHAQDNRITLTRGSVNALSSLHNLEVLNLNGNFDISLLDVGQMPHLRRLHLRGTGIDALPSGLLTRVRLYEADLRDNRIQSLSSAVFTAPSPINRRIILRNNPFTVDHQNLLAAYRARTGITFGIPETELALDEYSARQRWLADIEEGERRDALRNLWQDLRQEAGSEEFFVLLGRLGGSAEYQKVRADLTRRVWEVLAEAAENGALRNELFDLAADPLTCVDSAARNFSHLEVRVLLARALASKSSEPTELLKLACGLFRLERIDDIARNHVLALHESPELPSSSKVDELEVNLAYRVGLGRSLYLPGQPKEMFFRSIANVSEEQILAARSSIRQAERTPALRSFIASRDFWIDYLKKRYPRDFTRFNKPYHDQEELLLTQSPEMLSASYARRLSTLMETRIAEEQSFLEALTQHELDEHPAPF